jgi:hypothetical protein
MKILINYAHNRFYEVQKQNAASGMANGFDHAVQFRYDDLNPHFIERNIAILNQPRGAGYWIWKAQILLQTFEQCNEGDYVFYSDSGAKFISGINPLIPICDAEGGVLLFHLTPDPLNCEQVQTKGDVFHFMDCDHVKDMWPVLNAGFQLYKNNSFARYFVSKYLHYCEDARIVTDSENQIQPNYLLFQNHRHDQSVLSCLQKKMGIKSHLDITQFGNSFRKPSDGYGQIIDHTRSQS